MLEAYGSTALAEPLTYADWLGLYFNRTRVLCRRSLSIVMGIGVAFGKEPPKGWFSAIADSPEEGQLMALRAAVERRRAEAEAKMDTMRN